MHRPYRNATMQRSCIVHLEDLPAELVGKANDLGPFFPVSDRNEEHDTGGEQNDNVGELQEQVLQGQQVEVDQVKEKGVGEKQKNCQMYEPRKGGFPAAGPQVVLFGVPHAILPATFHP